MAGVTERPAPPDLSPRIAAVWTWTSPADPAPTEVAVLPDGCMDLLFRCPAGEDGWSAGEGALVVTGPDARPRPATALPGTGFVGIRFRPGMARAVLDADPGPLLGLTAPAGTVSRRLGALEERLADCRTPDAIAAGLLDGVRGLAGIGGDGPSRLPPLRVRAALDLIRGGSRIGDLPSSLGVTDRMLRRDVLAWTGLSPKMLARILRFQAALALLRTAPGPLAILALEAGYADQAHMTREFRELGDMTPSGFRRPDDVRSVQDRSQRPA